MGRHSRLSAIAALALFLAGPGPVAGQDLTGAVVFEGRLFTQDALREDLPGRNASLALELEWHRTSADRRHVFAFAPFVRVDQHDRERTHWDVREASWTYVGRGWELRAGVRKVFWGVLESNHLVDVVNQTDLVEDLDGEAKLGQPMVNLAIVRPWGTVDLFALIGFRERMFFGRAGRPGLPFPIDVDRSVVEGRHDVDWAARWSRPLGRFDVGVSHFHGTSRDPRFVGRTGSGAIALVPVYDVIDQTGVDLQMTQGGWLWKLEAINRAGQDRRFAAAAGGVEYTFANLRGSGFDLGVLLEYSLDERRREALTPLQDDIFFGARLAFNDVRSTEILAGASVDRTTGASFVNVEASRRFGERWTLDLALRSFVAIPPSDRFLSGVRRDDYVQAAWAFHF
jgi:hypothetical protein